MFANPRCPNLPDFVQFVRGQLNISAQLIPNPVVPDYITDQPAGNQVVDDDEQPVWADITNWLMIALAAALEVVNDDIAISCSGVIYTLAVYNLGADILINITPDPTGQKLMSDLRHKYKIEKPTTGVITSASNEGSSASVLNPEVMERLSPSQLQNMKTPWGRRYLGYAASVGTLWGLT